MFISTERRATDIHVCTHIEDPYLETLSGEQAEMLVSMESVLSTLIVSKAWLSRYPKASR